MQISMVTGGTLNGVWQDKIKEISNNDILVFGFNGLGLVSYKKELSGETEYFQDVANLSKQLSSVVVCGCDTDTYGVFRHSAVIADNGKILGVSDMIHCVDESEFVAGGSLRVYDTHAGRIGIIVENDIFFPDVTSTLNVCDVDIIICVMKKLNNFMPQIMLRAQAFSNGIAMVLCAKNYGVISDTRGEIVLSSNLDIISTKIKIEKDYHLICKKQRGLKKI